MSWYYAENNERRGPIEDAAFEALVSAGTITPQTLVWKEGMAEWTPYSNVGRPASPVTTPQPVATATAEMPVATAAGAQPYLQPCRECGRIFGVEEMISYEGRYVCPSCKPLFFQKIREGASVAGEREYAGFWIRFVAKFVDGILMNIVGRLLGMVVGMVVPDPTLAMWVAGGVGLIVGIAYTVYFVGKYGATLGKMACKLQIIRSDDSPMTYGRAAGRYFAEWLSGLSLGIGYIMAAFDPERRALHDRICDTRVIRKR
jgi:uncharacterized RDD family membrane protein YckC